MADIEEKILNGPQIHYCEADNDDIRESEGDMEDPVDCSSERAGSRTNSGSVFVKPDEESERLNRINHVRWRTGSTNTGPKGVLEDFKKTSTTTSTASKAKDKFSAKKNEIDELEAEFQELLNDDSIIKECISKRIASEINKAHPTFGQVFSLQTGNQLLDEIDKENPNVLVLVHLFTKYSRSCSNMNRCLVELARDLKHIKFVTLDASVTALSGNFKENGVPALLAYRGGDLVKSLVQVDDWLDRDFGAIQVKELLGDNSLLG